MNTIQRELVAHPEESSPSSTPWFARWRYAPIYGYFLVSAFFLFSIRVPEEPIGSLIKEDFFYLSIPIVLTVFGSTFQHRAFLYRTKTKPSQVWFQSVLLSVFAVFFAYPYQLAWNATAPNSTVLDLHGVVINKRVSHGKSTSYTVTVDEQTLNRPLSFHVSSSDFQRIEIGEQYSERMFLGRLGIPYRWRWQHL